VNLGPNEKKELNWSAEGGERRNLESQKLLMGKKGVNEKRVMLLVSRGGAFIQM